MITPDVEAPTLLRDEQVSLDTKHVDSVLPSAQAYLSLGDMDAKMVVGLIDTAVRHFESYTSHYINDQTRRIAFDRAVSRYRIPAKPVRSLDAVETVDEGAATTETIGDWYLFEAMPPEIRQSDSGADLSSDYQMIRFEYTAGYTDFKSVPDNVKTIIKKMVADLYEYRASKEEPLDNSLEETPLQWKDLLASAQVPYYAQPKSASDRFFL